MSSFDAHVRGGLVTGVILSGGHFLLFPGYLDKIQLAAVCLLCTVGGILPDLDSDTGKPLAILSAVLSLIAPAFMLRFMEQYHPLTPEFLICYFVLAYGVIHYIVSGLVKKITVHRGIFHSIPFVMLCGIFAYFLFSPSGQHMATAAGVAVFAGGITHLVMDEIHSLSWSSGGLPRPNNYTGTALKFWAPSLFSTLIVYSLLIAAAFYLFKINQFFF
ncbi:LexA-binding, inner membrane-associated putative hydrolase [Desulfocicer vacuolatum DSM 3385]|uniref:LexA-binding, inner membrane-associated putative hydrolase n=1 Tax=Desulfocicer vacuolatum DSM 3385 TaxID=1121400 RepID=A0A1W2EEY6_9BACT|nr:metal-dependent hydrolase [Desulfocicer vacuolatum]SMD08303.1 LexA-binding, inner membrane-associated putative hydrolase [Desulfocicer vacuolatum DSM 3385]